MVTENVALIKAYIHLVYVYISMQPYCSLKPVLILINKCLYQLLIW